MLIAGPYSYFQYVYKARACVYLYLYESTHMCRRKNQNEAVVSEFSAWFPPCQPESLAAL